VIEWLTVEEPHFENWVWSLEEQQGGVAGVTTGWQPHLPIEVLTVDLTAVDGSSNAING